MENVFVRYPKTLGCTQAFLGLLGRNAELIKNGNFMEIIYLYGSINDVEYNRMILSELSLATAKKKLFVIPDISHFIDSLNNEVESRFLMNELLNLPSDSKFFVGIPVVGGASYGHLGGCLEKKCDSVIYLNDKSKIKSQWHRQIIKFK